MSDTDELKKSAKKAAAGDRAAFEELYLATCRSVYFTCYGVLKDEQEAQDITQEVYLTAFRQLSTLEDKSKVKPWLYRIAANKSINCLKKKQPIPSDTEQLEGMEKEDNENFLPEEYALHADKRELVLKIVRETCSDDMYRAILLHYFNEFSVAEIAEIMECPEGTVKYWMSVARAKIKEGVLRYEKKSGDKLYSVAPIPFLTAWFTAQLKNMKTPPLSPDFLGALPQSAIAVSAAKIGGSMILKGLRLKVVAGIAAAVVAVGGITAAAVIMHDQNAEETSADGQEANGTDIADAGNSGDAMSLPENKNSENTETMQAESETGTEPEETAGEVTATESETAEETETADATPESTAKPELSYTYTDLDAIMYAKQTVNVRNLPSTDGAKVGALSANDEIAITGQCNETGWYRFEYNGATAYVSNNYVSDTRIETAAPAEAAAQASADNSSGGNSNDDERLNELIETYGMYTWNDFGNWFVYICASPEEKPPLECQEQYDTLYERYWDGVNTLYISYTSNEGLYFDSNVYVWFAALDHPKPQGLKNFIYKYGAPGAIDNHYYSLWLDD
ncbi:MAG: sigma-70 family RNA polymerase sigma factor [Lachnospiraceae bacterium]|nr:sigma-70 family RNA polymerase sigma factor [Lachnospiraceae bacterium]